MNSQGRQPLETPCVGQSPDKGETFRTSICRPIRGFRAAMCLHLSIAFPERIRLRFVDLIRYQIHSSLCRFRLLHQTDNVTHGDLAGGGHAGNDAQSAADQFFMLALNAFKAIAAGAGDQDLDDRRGAESQF